MIEICPCCQESNLKGAYTDASWQDDERHIVVSSDSIAYTIGDCRRFRNFMAHGAADAKGKLLVGSRFVPEFISRACGAMDRYFRELKEDSPNGSELRTRLAKAQFLPLWSGGRPLFVGDLYGPLCQPGTMPGGALLHEKHWRQR